VDYFTHKEPELGGQAYFYHNCKKIAGLDQLEKITAAENTIVLSVSDNDADLNSRNNPYRGCKSSLWEGGIRVPSQIRWPGMLLPATITSQVGLTMDLLPTLLAATGVYAPPEQKFDGVDMLAGSRQQ